FLCQKCDTNRFFGLFSFYCLYYKNLKNPKSLIISNSYSIPLERIRNQRVVGSIPIAGLIYFSLNHIVNYQ
ncbi:MAG: hypothetical protein ACFFDN_31830, partial [Candidatus Hodarchaeota archaeon]